jgi:hypothetical protein
LVQVNPPTPWGSYESIADTIVQLFISCPSVVLASLQPDSIGMCTVKEKGMNMQVHTPLEAAKVA